MQHTTRKSGSTENPDSTPYEQKQLNQRLTQRPYAAIFSTQLTPPAALPMTADYCTCGGVHRGTANNCSETIGPQRCHIPPQPLLSTISTLLGCLLCSRYSHLFQGENNQTPIPLWVSHTRSTTNPGICFQVWKCTDRTTVQIKTPWPKGYAHSTDSSNAPPPHFGGLRH